MNTIWHVLRESFNQAWQQLKSNTLRTLLSVLGVSIGIFCIISVLAAVDSLEYTIKQSFEKLGDDVLHVSKMPWDEDPQSNYWKYMRRPNPGMKDFHALQRSMTGSELIAYYVFLGGTSINYKSNRVDGSYLFTCSKDYFKMYDVEIEQGRSFSDFEFNSGAEVTILGSKLATSLFENINPVGKEIKIKGRKMRVIGVIKATGESLINIMNMDWVATIPLSLGAKMSNLNSTHMRGNSLAVKAKPGVSLEELNDELTINLRKTRRLSPKEENNFSLNALSMFTKILDSFFSVLNIVGNLIGGFSLIVGLFSVANIMFVSVYERTPQIGVKKALGAENYMILIEFLMESIILCFMGGLVGIFLVFLLIQIMDGMTDTFTFYLSPANVSIGLTISTVIGMLAGIIPAIMAARKDPVEAMRS